PVRAHARRAARSSGARRRALERRFRAGRARPDRDRRRSRTPTRRGAGAQERPSAAEPRMARVRRITCWALVALAALVLAPAASADLADERALAEHFAPIVRAGEL